MKATVFAPASVANLCVGFDHLGMSMDAIGDKVTVELEPASENQVEITFQSDASLPFDPTKNTASVAAKSVLDRHSTTYKAKLEIEKGIPKSSGLGGSASSAVAAAMAVQHLLQADLDQKMLVSCMVDGESMASGARHKDNVVPSYYGGVHLMGSGYSRKLKAPEWFCVCVHPHHEVETAKARAVLPESVPIAHAIEQAHSAMAFIHALQHSDFDLVKKTASDQLITPYRRALIPHFEEVYETTKNRDCAAFSISGAGPTVMTFCEDFREAETIKQDIIETWKSCGMDSEGWVSPLNSQGAQVL